MKAYQHQYSQTVTHCNTIHSVIPTEAYAYTNVVRITADNCERIEKSAFYNVQTLSYLNLPKVKYVGATAFFNCRNLQEVHLPECLELQDACFCGCTELRRVHLGNCQYIGCNVFKWCINLRYLELNDRCKFGYQAFECTPELSIKVKREHLAWYKETYPELDKCAVF